MTNLVEPETAGDPMTKQKWTRRSLRQISDRLGQLGQRISPPTVGRLLKGLDYALHVNAKKREAREGHPDRDAQFDHIAQERERFTRQGLPIISVDSKKKELIGNFKNAGRSWSREPEAVNVHDFLSEAQGRAVPYGIYDMHHNCGTVVVGQSAVCGRGHRTLVGHGRRVRVSGRERDSDLGGRGREQWVSSPPLEAANPGTVVRWAWPDRHRLSLSHRLFEVDYHRASAVRADQHQLGRQAVAHLGDPAGIPARDDDRDRLGGICRPRRSHLRNGSQRPRCGDADLESRTSSGLPDLELHPASTDNRSTSPTGSNINSGTCCLTSPKR